VVHKLAFIIFDMDGGSEFDGSPCWCRNDLGFGKVQHYDIGRARLVPNITQISETISSIENTEFRLESRHNGERERERGERER